MILVRGFSVACTKNHIICHVCNRSLTPVCLAQSGHGYIRHPRTSPAAFHPLAAKILQPRSA